MKIYITTYLLVISIYSFAQDKILVNYIYKNEFDISNIEDHFILNLYKNSNDKTFYYTLLIDGQEAIYENVDRIDNSQEKDKPAITGPLGKSYMNLHTRETLYEAELAEKYIIKDTISKIDWVIERERGSYLGLETRKATYKNEYLSYEAWFVPSIPLKFGPNSYGDLPGLIVKFTHYFTNKFGSHKRIIVAENIEINPKIKLQKPTKGKLISQKDFNKIVEEQNKKYQEIENNQVETKLD